MENPWPHFPRTAPYVLPEDAPLIVAFNRTARSEHRFHLDVLPEPFLGAPDAPVLMLNLNPGYNVHNVVNHARSEFIRANRAQLEHRAAEYPFYLLDPAVEFDSGHHWWSKRLRQPIEALGRRAVAAGLLCVEFFPYHSKKCGFPTRTRIPSQTYSFHLVRQAMARGAPVLLMRARKYWCRGIPELATYPRLHTLRNARSPYLSRRNCPDGYDAILEAISAVARSSCAA